MQERIQKILSARGIASRRKAEEYILQGLVTVNGKVAELGQKADPVIDRIEVQGKVLADRQQMLYYVMNKPVGVETSNVERHRPSLNLRPARRGREGQNSTEVRTVRDLLPAHLQGKIFPVGRLDKDSSGLLLFTNDGVLAYRLTHPKFTHEKEYEVVLGRAIEPLALRKLEEGFELDGSMTKPLKAWKIAPNIIRIVLTEGRNRQIRRMCQNVGYTVKELQRVRIMTLNDRGLRPGTLRILQPAEQRALLRALCLDTGREDRKATDEYSPK